MKNEAQFKTVFKKSVRAHNGYSISLAAPMLPGIPDLYVVMKTYIPVLLEAKFLGEIKREKFSRKPGFTDLQTHFIKSCHDVAAYSALGLIGLKYLGTYYAILVPYDSVQFSQVNNSFNVCCSFVPLDPIDKTFNIPKLFEGVPIPRIANPIEPQSPIYDPIRDQDTLAVRH